MFIFQVSLGENCDFSTKNPSNTPEQLDNEESTLPSSTSAFSSSSEEFPIAGSSTTQNRKSVSVICLFLTIKVTRLMVLFKWTENLYNRQPNNRFIQQWTLLFGCVVSSLWPMTSSKTACVNKWACMSSLKRICATDWILAVDYDLYVC